MDDYETFICADCRDPKSTYDAAYDVEGWDNQHGTICLACAYDLVELERAWPRREVA